MREAERYHLRGLSSESVPQNISWDSLLLRIFEAVHEATYL